MKNLFLLLLLFLPVVLLAGGCGPTAQYTDPLAEIAVMPPTATDPTKPRLGIVFSENTRKSVKLVEDTRSFASLGGVNFAFNHKEIDARYLVQKINEALAPSFSTMTVYTDMAAVDTQTVDVIMVLDIQISMGKMSFAQTEVKIMGLFLDPQGAEIDRISGDGSAMVPYPAWTYSFKPALEKSMAQFSGSLGSSRAISRFEPKRLAQSSPRHDIAQADKPTPSPASVLPRPGEAGAETLPTDAKTLVQGPEPQAAPPGEAARPDIGETAVPAGEDATGNSWAVVIGIARYKFSGEGGLDNLVFADDDALSFVSSLHSLGWRDSHIKLLLNKEATQRNIVIALESWLTKAKRSDRIVLFWAGHGYPDPEDPEKVYFACYDTEMSIPATGYRMDKVREALAEREARNVLVFADTCHAGKLITRGTRGLSIVSNIREMSRAKSIPKGWVFMVGADTDRQAVEHSSWTNGAFTHFLIKGLAGEADGYQSAGPRDGVITMGELKDYLTTVMPDETHKILGAAKHPVITTSTGDPEIWRTSLQP